MPSSKRGRPKKIWTEDYQKVQRLIQGDQQAGCELFTNLLPLLEAFIRKYSKPLNLTPEEIADLKNDTILTALLKIETFAKKAKFSTWVLGIAKNKILCERAKKVKETKQILACIHSFSLHQELPLCYVLKKEEYQVLQEAYHQLPDREKIVIYLRFFAYYTEMEIAKSLSISQPEVSYLSKQACQKMRLFIENNYGENFFLYITKEA